MKKFTLLVAMIATAFAVKAQDLIVLRNATEIQAKVVEISPKSVTYKRWSNPDGPTYTISKSEVFYIKYKNGEKDVLAEMTATPATPATPAASSASVASAARVVSNAPVEVAPSKPKKKSTLAGPIKFAGHVLVGTEFSEVDLHHCYSSGCETETCPSGGPTIEVNVGAKFFEYFYIGIEAGVRSMLVIHDDPYSSGTDKRFFGYVPIGVNMKGYFTRGKKVNPYLNCSLGGFIGVGDMLADCNGFSCQVGAGIEFGRFSFGIGYSGMKCADFAQNSGYVKLGVRFGK